MTEGHIHPGIIRDIERAGYVLIRKAKLRSLHLAASMDEFAVEQIKTVDLRNIVKQRMASDMAHNLMDSEYVRIVEERPKPDDPYWRYRMDLRLVIP